MRPPDAASKTVRLYGKTLQRSHGVLSGALSRKALAIADTELKLITSAATIGESNCPESGVLLLPRPPPGASTP
jgi:hypothetical protein